MIINSLSGKNTSGEGFEEDIAISGQKVETIIAKEAGLRVDYPINEIYPGGKVSKCAYSKNGVYLAMANTAYPFLAIYKRNGDTLTKLPSPADLPPLDAYGVCFSPDSNYLVVAHNISNAACGFIIYKRNGDEFTKIALGASDMLKLTCYDAEFSPDGVYLAVGLLGYNAMKIYKRNGDTFTLLPAAFTSGTSMFDMVSFVTHKVSWSSDGIYLAAGIENNSSANNCVIVYKRSGDTFTKLTVPDVIPAAGSAMVARDGGSGCAWLSNTHIAVTHKLSPCVSILKRNGDAFTKLPNPAVLPTGTNGIWCEFSPDGNYLVVDSNSPPYCTVYKRSGDTFTKVSNIDPPRYGGALAKFTWAPDGTELIACTSLPNFTIYKRNGDVFTPRPTNPAYFPIGGVNYGCKFSPDGKYLVALFDYNPNVYIYKIDGNNFNIVDFESLGWSNDCSFSSDNKYFTIAINYRPFFAVYKITNGVFNKIYEAPEIDAPAERGTSIKFSPDTNYIAYGGAMGPFITMYKRVDDTFTKIPVPNILSSVMELDWSPDGVHLAVMQNKTYNANAGVTIFKHDGDDFEIVTTLTDFSTNFKSIDEAGLTWSPDGNYLVLVGGDQLMMYKRNGDDFILTTPKAALTTSKEMKKCVFTPSGKYLIVTNKDQPYYLEAYAKVGDHLSRISIAEFPLPAGGTRMDVSPDGKLLAVPFTPGAYMNIFPISEFDGEAINLGKNSLVGVKKDFVIKEISNSEVISSNLRKVGYVGKELNKETGVYEVVWLWY